MGEMPVNNYQSSLMGNGAGPDTSGGLQSVADTLGVINDTVIHDPNDTQYTNQYNTQNANANQYGQLAANAQGRTGATINNQFQGQSQANLAGDRGGLSNALQQQQQVASGQGPSAAQTGFQSGLNQSVESNMALANSGRGGASQRAGAMRSAQEQNAQMLGNASSQEASAKANEQLGAMGQEANTASAMGSLDQSQYGLEQNTADQQAQLQQQQQAQNDQQSTNLYGLQQTAQSGAQGALNSYTSGLSGADSLRSNQGQQNAQSTGGILSGITSAIGGVAGVFSDERLKEEIEVAPDTVDAFLRHARPRSFKYRQEVGEGTRPQIGVIAQEVEQTPGIGHTIVRDTPAGKMLDGKASLSAVMAGVGRLNERLERLESGKGR